MAFPYTCRGSHATIGLMDFGTFQSWAETLGVPVSEPQFQLLSEYVRLLAAKNEEVNLTAIRDEREAWIKHILDSIAPAKIVEFKSKSKWIDIGTGGGLPGIPLAILYPHADFVLLDSVQKKVEAIKGFVDSLHLMNVQAIWERAEVLGQDSGHREQYDGVLTRAVAPLRILLELGIPLIHPYGHVVIYKGPDYITELNEARNSVVKLHAESPRVYHYALPEGMGDRTILEATKKEPTPATYPRRPGTPNKKPL